MKPPTFRLSPMKKFFLAAAMMFCVCAPARSTVYSTIDLAGPLESLGFSARAAAMGSAFTAVEGETDCLYWNPAGLAGISSTRLSLNHQSWIQGVFQETLVLAVPIRGACTFAVGSSYLNYGNMDGYNDVGDPAASYQPYRFSAGIGCGAKPHPDISIGLAARMLRQTIARNTYESLFLGFGASWSPLKALRLGVAYSDLALLARDFSAAGALHAGLACSIREDLGTSTLLTADMFMPPYGVYRAEFGAEQTLWSDYFLRVGCQLDLVDNAIQGLQSVSGGFGVRYDNLTLDYSYVPMGDLGSAQRVSLSYRFGEEAVVPGREVAPQPAAPVDFQIQPKAVTPEPAGILRPAEANTLPAVTPSPDMKPTPAIPAPTPSQAIVEPPKRPAPQTAVDFHPASKANPSDEVVKVEIKMDLENKANPTPAAGQVDPRWGKWLRQYEQAVKDDPRNARNWRNLGALYLKMGRGAEAVQCFQEALRLNPNDPAFLEWMKKNEFSAP
jgi:hypothetical protein